jgi:hypothetical protein
MQNMQNMHKVEIIIYRICNNENEYAEYGWKIICKTKLEKYAEKYAEYVSKYVN